VSDDLLARFQAAIEETESNTDEDPATALAKKQEQPTNSEIKSLTEMPAWVQEGVPSLRFEQHIYASDGEGWVNVNGRDRSIKFRITTLKLNMTNNASFRKWLNTESYKVYLPLLKRKLSMLIIPISLTM